MLGIPPAKDSDAEDVAWGLQTAETLWKRGERIDAVVWLRRAAQAAGEATDDDRALELARAAAELSDWMATLPSAAPAAPDVVSAPPQASASKPPDLSMAVDLDEDTARGPLPGLSPPPHGPRPMPPRSVPPSQPTMQTAEPSFEDRDGEEQPAGTTSVPPADRVHAGMFNPWDDRVSAAPPQPIAPPPPRTPQFVGEDEIVTSVRPEQLQQQRADALAAALAGGTPQSEAPPPPAPAPWAEEAKPEPPKAAPSKPTPGKPPPLPLRATMKSLGPSAPAPPRAPSPSPIRVTPPAVSPTQVTMQHPEAPPAAPVPAEVDKPRSPEPMVAAPEAAAAAPPVEGPLDLEDVEAFADLPDDARRAFAAAAEVSALGEGEEVSSFALAYILSGSVDVAATMVDASAARLEGGAVLRSRGTTLDGVPMRLIGVKSGVVATWTDAAVQEAFRTCPWVEEDLRVAADRLQTLVGVTIGPLGERLDASIREQIIERLTMRTLIAGDVVVTAGEQMPGLLLIGVGELELVDGDTVAGVVGSGEFLFPTVVLGGGNAPNTARAGKGGALILFGDRKIAQELLVTCPPLLEVFAGM